MTSVSNNTPVRDVIVMLPIRPAVRGFQAGFHTENGRHKLCKVSQLNFSGQNTQKVISTWLKLSRVF